MDSLVDELMTDRDHARRINQPATAIAATMSAAKLAGLLIDKHETGEPGAFGDSTDTVLARVAAELGADAAADLARALERGPNTASTPPLDDPPSPLPLPSTGGNDTLN